MKIVAKIFTIIEYAISGILWLLGILTLLFNILGLWGPWHLAGFAFLFFIPVPVIPLILSIIFSFISRSLRLKVANFISLGISIASVLIYFFISAGWLW